MHFCRMQAPRLCAAPSTRAPLQSFSRWARRTQGAAAVDLVAERRAALHAACRLGLQLRLARLHGLRLQHLRGGGGAGRGLRARRALSTPCRNHPGMQGPPARAPQHVARVSCDGPLAGCAPPSSPECAPQAAGTTWGSGCTRGSRATGRLGWAGGRVFGWGGWREGGRGQGQGARPRCPSTDDRRHEEPRPSDPFSPAPRPSTP